MTHTCRYRDTLQWGQWAREGRMLRREARRVPICVECGCERPARRPRRVVQYEVRAAGKSPGPLPDETARRVASGLLRRARRTENAEQQVSVKGLVGSTRLPGSLVEQWLDAFLDAGWVGLQYRVQGTRRTPVRVIVLDAGALAELARPGVRQAVQAAISDARQQLKDIDHPVAEKVADILSNDDAVRSDPDLVRALAALALFANGGEVCAERVFSVQYLGDSKKLGRLRARLERLLGPLGELGIRPGAATTLVGGEGRIAVGQQALDLRVLRSFVGLSRETIEALSNVTLPENGLLVVENLTAFEACCRGEVHGVSQTLVVWSAGYPGRSVEALVRSAVERSAPIRVWADIDLDGIRIARLVCRWANGRARPWRMSPADLKKARTTLPLSDRAARAIASDMESRPGALLRETLKAILERGRWAEQETLLWTGGD
jgi:hypothetical protein